MTTTKLSPWGGSQAADASYAGKPENVLTKAGIFTRLHLGGFSRAFAVDNYTGKEQVVVAIRGTYIPTFRGRRGRR